MSDSSNEYPTAWHHVFSRWVLQARHPRMSMASLGWPMLYTLGSSVLIYGVALVILATNSTSTTALALSTAVLALVALVTLWVATVFVLKLLFMPLNVERDPLTDLLDFVDAWVAYINGLTSIAMIVFVWDNTAFGAALPGDPIYRVWLRLLFTATHDFHSAGFGVTQAVKDWGLVTFILISYAGRLVLVLGLTALARLMSRNLKRFDKRYVIRGISNRMSSKNGKRSAREHRLAQVGMDRQSKRAVARRGTLRDPSTVSLMETPGGGYALHSSRSGRSRK